MACIYTENIDYCAECFNRNVTVCEERKK